jgi:hypothetical protein
VTRPALLALRVVWLTLPVTAGPALEDALAGPSESVRWTMATGLWAGWGVGLLALLVPRIPSLTTLRLAAPAAVAASATAAVATGVQAVDVLGLVATSLALALTLWPEVAEALVDGSSYGPERRLPVRVPPVLAAGPIPLATAITLAGIASGPLLLAAEQWVAGVVATVVGLALAALAVRSLHTVSQRFLVLVPGGVVVHDPMALVEPVLLPKASLAAVGPALAGTEATDLTLGALGLVLELRLRRRVELVRRRSREVVTTDAVLVSPTRPATFLAEAKERRLPVSP